jgi:cell division protein FtsN
MILVGALALAGCQMTTDPGSAPVDGSVPQQVAGPGQRVIERDVEAPDVFQVEDAGLWDGRPSLGGVWVAHPNVEDPERALIRNTATGATVIGALFRRERDNPGPRFQVSSEAANALGLLPGAPTEIAVTALRLQRVELEIDPAPAPAPTAADETLTIAPVASADAAPAAGAPAGQVDIIDQDPPRRGLRDLFRRREPEPAAAIAQTALAPVAGTETAAAGATAAGTTASEATAAAAAAAAAATATAEPPRERRSLRDLFRRREPEPDTTMIALPGDDGPAAQPAAQPAVQPAVQPQGPRIDRPFVQIGIFSVEQNAQNARGQMQRAGLSAEIRRGRVGENLFWRVVVGPAGTATERATILRQVRGMGFADAYTVVR